jgi:hypothetical protein
MSRDICAADAGGNNKRPDRAPNPALLMNMTTWTAVPKSLRSRMPCVSLAIADTNNRPVPFPAIKLTRFRPSAGLKAARPGAARAGLSGAEICRAGKHTLTTPAPGLSLGSSSGVHLVPMQRPPTLVITAEGAMLHKLHRITHAPSSKLRLASSRDQTT